MKSIKIKIALAMAILLSSFSMAMPSLALDCTSPVTPKDEIQCGACDAAGTPAANCKPANAEGTLHDTLVEVINIISVLAGAVAVVMIIIGGFRFVTSAGNAESTKSARNTIVYAVIGLVIIAMAQIIVHFVLNNVANDCVNGKTTSGLKCTP